ncbi:NAD(P)H-dependent flavin oxidoreductase [Roseibium sp. M-1]
MSSSHHLLERIGIRLPIVQAPMAGVSSPSMAAAVSNAGALGSIGVGSTDTAGARAMIAEIRAQCALPFNVNLFCHRPAVSDAELETRWIDRLRSEFSILGSAPPDGLTEIYRSFVEDDEMLAMLLEERPGVVSFHFGLPRKDAIRALREAGILLLASATSLAEARLVANSGVDVIVAQGWEAGGHRGVFDPDAPDDRIGVMALTRSIIVNTGFPVIAAGGIMDGAGIAAALRLGASAAQLGTAFILCEESLADDGYRTALRGEAAFHTEMTSVISGRPARCLPNKFTKFGAGIQAQSVPDYPIAYDLGKTLHASAKAKGDFGFGAQWAGQGAPLARAMPAAALVAELETELRQATR